MPTDSKYDADCEPNRETGEHHHVDALGISALEIARTNRTKAMSAIMLHLCLKGLRPSRLRKDASISYQLRFAGSYFEKSKTRALSRPIFRRQRGP
jgi:hypothetical protein